MCCKSCSPTLRLILDPSLYISDFVIKCKCFALAPPPNCWLVFRISAWFDPWHSVCVLLQDNLRPRAHWKGHCSLKVNIYMQLDRSLIGKGELKSAAWMCPLTTQPRCPHQVRWQTECWWLAAEGGSTRSPGSWRSRRGFSKSSSPPATLAQPTAGRSATLVMTKHVFKAREAFEISQTKN